MNIEKILKFIGIFFIYFLGSSIFIIPLIILNINPNTLSLKEEIFFMLISNLFVSIVLFLIYRKYLIEKFKDFKENFKKYFKLGLKYWGIGLGIMYFINFLLYNFSPATEAGNEESVQLIIKTAPMLAFLLTTVFAPFIEEIVFRKAIKDCFNIKWLFIIVSALIFGGLHVTDATNIFEFLYIFSYGALGGAFAYLLYKTDNIYVTIMMHLIHNGILTLLSIFI